MKNRTRTFLVVAIYTLFCLLLSEFLHDIAFLGLGILAWLYVYHQIRQVHSTEFSTIGLVILSVPLSFTDIFGNLKGGTMLTWFNLFFLLTFLIVLAKGLYRNKITITPLSFLTLLTVFVTVIPLLKAEDFFDGFKQYINVVVALFALVLGNLVSSDLSNEEKLELRRVFTVGVLIAGIGVFVQIVFVHLVGRVVGYFQVFGSFRNAYGFLFLDFSFLSLYLSAGAMMAISLRNHYREKRLEYSAITIFLLVASVATSARTGFASFVAAFLLYSAQNFLAYMPKAPIRSLFLIFAGTIILFGGFRVFTYFRPSGFSSDSGRSVLNAKAFQIFKNNPLVGVGFGGTSYYDKYGIIPHNLVFQSLAQGGILFTVPIIVLLCAILLLTWRRDKDLFFVLTTVIIGSFFIPNIFNSRFLPVIFLLIGISV